ncbi:MAG: hypothetical protein LBQ00_09395 [Syntrophobacterales bacterium]|nr:hypothetical protein [Syntrophobacterales bacterium]
MTTDELAELLLAYLYDKAEAEAHNFFFFPLVDFATAAGITDHVELRKIAEGLEELGLVMLSQDMLGQISALINLEGNSYVEDGGKTGIIGKYRENPEVFVKENDVPAWLNAPNIELAEFTPPAMEAPAGEYGLGATEKSSMDPRIRDLILQIIKIILDDTSIDDVTRADMLRDAETLNIQLAKTSRNKTIIDALLVALSSMPSAVYSVAQLTTYI